MNFNSVGDNARAFALQNASHRLKSTIDVLTSELTSGKVADITQRVRGNLQPLNHIENRIQLLGQFQRTSVEAAGQADAMQAALGDLHAISEKLGIDLAINLGSGTPEILAVRSKEAASAFETAISRLNTSIAGAFVFAGTEYDSPPLRPAEDILAELTDLVSGAATPADIDQALDLWFSAPPGGDGYLDFAYLGSLDKVRHMPVSAHEKTAFEIDAANPAIRNTLKSLAMGALVDRGIMAGSSTDQREMLRLAGQNLYADSASLVALRGHVGMVQQRIETASTENSNALASFEIARNNLVSADPFTTSTALTEVQTQLETLYALTARLSNLKLVDYLR